MSPLTDAERYAGVSPVLGENQRAWQGNPSLAKQSQDIVFQMYQKSITKAALYSQVDLGSASLSPFKKDQMQGAKGFSTISVGDVIKSTNGQEQLYRIAKAYQRGEIEHQRKMKSDLKQRADDAKALRFYTEAAMQGYKPAIYEIARMLEKEESQESIEKAITVYQNLAEEGNVDACNRLGSIYNEQYSLFHCRDNLKCAEIARAQANLYYSKAQTLGKITREGRTFLLQCGQEEQKAEQKVSDFKGSMDDLRKRGLVAKPSKKTKRRVENEEGLKLRLRKKLGV